MDTLPLATHVSVETFTTPLHKRLADSTHGPQAGEVLLYWLGQAGFVIEWAGVRMLIDPYLSDSLAHKYRGTRFPHTRMMAPPLDPAALDRLDLVLCTHRHTDHMDPGTLQPLAQRFPALKFVVPAASIDEAMKRCGVDASRLIPVNAEQRVDVLPRISVSPIASAHETLDQDEHGLYPWLGYVIELGNDAESIRLYHSGDCVPYAELPAQLARHAPDLALLPVNGRDIERSGNGVPGNFTLDEAVALAKAGGVRAMLAHHYGLFDFNTVAPETIDARAQQERAAGLEIYRAQTGRVWRMRAPDRRE
ncbi:MBL fold metallo-hydrolase [Paraburkholderia sp. DHOC27]|uniref:MBL fold metallo-hydrolase n=1 Tax=Paraburkholderia sp. DHOC27 TaxID=2303330 RepID=UPI000E3E5FD1|nr:MBL fold metallo-hydrolase [Paraburkholderia sp. DHOC27]RFU44981.1 MBL fold metallo-hydrolase [Paraburkholderia sp. DHOC27]